MSQVITKYKGGSLNNAPIADALFSPKDAVQLYREFFAIPTASGETYTLTGAPVLAPDTTLSTGVLSIASPGTPIAFGVCSPVPLVTPAQNRNVYAEWYVAQAVTSASAAQFVGLSSSGIVSPVTSVGAMNGTQSGVGFVFIGTEVRAVNAAGATVASTTLPITSSVKLFHRLGFVMNGVSSIDYYLNGQLMTTARATTGIPIVPLYESYSTAGTVATGCFVDWFQLAYQR